MTLSVIKYALLYLGSALGGFVFKVPFLLQKTPVMQMALLLSTGGQDIFLADLL